MEILDRDGILDPTNPTGPYFGEIDSLLQASICRWDPVEMEWQSRFRGWTGDFDYSFDPSQRVNRLTVELIDIFALLSAIEMLPGEFGDDPTTDAPDSIGQVWFDEATMDGRIVQALTNAGIPEDRYVVFSGNVALPATPYSPGESPLTVIQEAADAEFPSVSNVYTDRYGRLAAHGRLAKFDPAGTEASTAYTAWSGATAYTSADVDSNRVTSGGLAYRCILGHTNHVPPNPTYWVQIPKKWDWRHWLAGDGAAVAVAPSTIAQLRAFGFNRGLSMIRNSALATPMGILDADMPGQVVKDAVSIGLRGIRSWSAQNLLTLEGLADSSTALEETRRFSEYVIANYAEPRNRITDIVFKSFDTGRTGAEINWRLLCNIDIADQLDVTIGSPGGGGFNDEECFVEGIHEESRPLNAEYDMHTVSLDLSPKALFGDVSMFP